MVKNPSVTRETWVRSLGQEDTLEKGMATHSGILAWRIPGRPQSIGSQKVRHDWVTNTLTERTQTCWYKYPELKLAPLKFNTYMLLVSYPPAAPWMCTQTLFLELLHTFRNITWFVQKVASQGGDWKSTRGQENVRNNCHQTPMATYAGFPSPSDGPKLACLYTDRPLRILKRVLPGIEGHASSDRFPLASFL